MKEYQKAGLPVLTVRITSARFVTRQMWLQKDAYLAECYGI